MSTASDKADAKADAAADKADAAAAAKAAKLPPVPAIEIVTGEQLVAGIENGLNALYDVLAQLNEANTSRNADHSRVAATLIKKLIVDLKGLVFAARGQSVDDPNWNRRTPYPAPVLATGVVGPAPVNADGSPVDPNDPRWNRPTPPVGMKYDNSGRLVPI